MTNAILGAIELAVYAVKGAYDLSSKTVTTGRKIINDNPLSRLVNESSLGRTVEKAIHDKKLDTYNRIPKMMDYTHMKEINYASVGPFEPLCLMGRGLFEIAAAPARMMGEVYNQTVGIIEPSQYAKERVNRR